MDIMDVSVTTTKPRSIYVTAHDRKAGKSRTITLRGDKLTPNDVIQLLLKAVKRNGRKAG